MSRWVFFSLFRDSVSMGLLAFFPFFIYFLSVRKILCFYSYGCWCYLDVPLAQLSVRFLLNHGTYFSEFCGLSLPYSSFIRSVFLRFSFFVSRLLLSPFFFRFFFVPPFLVVRGPGGPMFCVPCPMQTCFIFIPGPTISKSYTYA